MSTTTETTIVTLDQIEVKNLPELQGWKDKQHAIVKENPFIAIEDNKSYEEAKKHRTNLVSARTDIQKQDKLIASKLKELRTQAGEVRDELIAISQPHEEKQQDEVKRYEAKKEEERLEKERIEQERKEAIQKSISDFYSKWKKTIAENLTFKNIDDVKLDLVTAIDEQKEKDLEEFELDFTEKKNLLISQLDERVKYLTEQENLRVEREKIAKEKARNEKLRPYISFIRDYDKVLNLSDEDFEKEISSLNQQAIEQQKFEAEEKAKQQEAEEKAKAEQKQKEEEAQKLQQKTFNIRCNRLEEVGFEANDLGNFVNKELELELDSAEDDVYGMDIEDFEDFIQNAKTKLVNAKAEADREAKEEAELKAKQEAEEKARQEAEAKRLKELQPEKDKLKLYVNSLNLSEETPEIKDESLLEVLERFENEVENLKQNFLNEVAATA